MALKSITSNVKSAWSEAGGWVILVVAIWMLWSFRKLFSSVGGGVGNAAEAILAKTVADAQAKVDAANAEAQKAKDKTKVQAAAGTSIKYTDAQIATFRADAESLAGYLKTLSSLPWLERQLSFANAQAAFSMIKQRYSRLNLYNNKPFAWKDAAHKNIIPQNAETSASVKNPINYKVLIPFYKEATDSRDLVSDLRKVLGEAPYATYLKWIL